MFTPKKNAVKKCLLSQGKIQNRSCSSGERYNDLASGIDFMTKSLLESQA